MFRPAGERAHPPGRGHTLVQGLLRVSILIATLPAAPPGAAESEMSADELWQLAADAYQTGDTETGHLHLKTLMDRNTADLDLTIQCLEEVLTQGRRHDTQRLAEQPELGSVDGPSTARAARQLCALERLGAVSANHDSVKSACVVLVGHHFRSGQLFAARELVDRYAGENPHDLFWQILQARIHRRLESAKTRALFRKLSAGMDLDHPDPATRELWMTFSRELEEFGRILPPEIQPPPRGSPLALMEPDDPDREWDMVATRSPRLVTEIIDRLAARALSVNQAIPWRDGSGLTDPGRALDLHLLSQPQDDLEPLRNLQEGRVVLEDLGSSPGEATILATFRRYAWAPSAQNQLLALANRMLFAGRAQSALRCFRDLLQHARDRETRDAAQVGIWTTLVQIDSPASVDELLGGVAPDRTLSWLGTPVRAGEICRQLLANRAPPPAPSPDLRTSTLKDLVPHVVRMPPVSPWSGELPGEVDLTVVGQDLLVSGREMLAKYDARQPGQPLWRYSPPPAAGENKDARYYPGYFLPPCDQDRLYTRWGYGSQPPRGIAAIDRTTGDLLWSNQNANPNHPLRTVPLGDPVPADGFLYYLQWASQNEVTNGRGRRLDLVCFDPHRRGPAWQQTIALGGHTSDHTGSLERTSPDSAIYGNRVTVHEGAVYSSTNCGMIVRSDVRDGRTEWLYHYPVLESSRRNVLNQGAPPLIAGDRVICMPRDASRIFALDLETGRLLWNNSMVLGLQLVGVVDDLVIVRGRALVAGLDLKTGEARWYRPTSGEVLGRLRLLQSSVCLAYPDGLHRLDAKTGRLEEVSSWELADESPQNFAIRGRDLYVVTDKPSEYPGQPVNQPLNPSAPEEAPPLALPLARAWSLPRDNAKIMLPPPDSELRGSAFVLSRGILERIELSARGRIRWQRFVQGHHPGIHIIGTTVLVVDHAMSRAPGLVNRVVALDGLDGRTLWQRVVEAPVQSSLNCGATQLFHDAAGRLVAIDLATGSAAWERNLGNGFQMRLSWDGTHVHIFFVSRMRAARHLVIDARSGRTVRDYPIAANTSADAKNATPIKGGYYEVTFDPVDARYVRLTALSEVNGRGWASIAELHVVDPDGRNLPRANWTVTASNSETKARYDTRPVTTIDDDPVTWWHSQWIGAIPPHPHSLTIDMGAPQTVTGIRYLPAVIVNNNGMIREYELHVSQDGQNWGTPVAAGFLVNRTRVDSVYPSGKSVVFESRPSPNQPLSIYRYALNGKPAVLVQRESPITFVREPFFFTRANDHLVVKRFDDPAYQFALGPADQLDGSCLEIRDNRLVLGRKGVLVADLAEKRFIIPPGDGTLLSNQDGVVLREGENSLLKIVSQGEEGHAVFHFDLRTGEKTESILPAQTEQVQGGHQGDQGTIVRFDGLVLLGDNSSVSGWITAAP